MNFVKIPMWIGIASTLRPKTFQTLLKTITIKIEKKNMVKNLLLTGILEKWWEGTDCTTTYNYCQGLFSKQHTCASQKVMTVWLWLMISYLFNIEEIECFQGCLKIKQTVNLISTLYFSPYNVLAVFLLDKWCLESL